MSHHCKFTSRGRSHTSMAHGQRAPQVQQAVGRVQAAVLGEPGGVVVGRGRLLAVHFLDVLLEARHVVHVEHARALGHALRQAGALQQACARHTSSEQSDPTELFWSGTTLAQRAACVSITAFVIKPRDWGHMLLCT